MKNEDRDKVKNEILTLMKEKEIPSLEQFVILIATLGYVAAKAPKTIMNDIMMAYSMLGILLRAIYDNDIKEDKLK